MFELYFLIGSNSSGIDAETAGRVSSEKIETKDVQEITRNSGYLDTRKYLNLVAGEGCHGVTS